MTVSIPQSERLMRRGQSTLVAAYAATLSTGVAYGRHFTSAGTTHKATRRRFQDFLKNTLTDSGKQAIETESTGSGPIRLTTESQTFIAEYILRFVTQSFLLNLFDKDRVAYIRRKFGDPNYVPPEVTALLRAILPKYWPPHDISSTF